ncbi:uncharacterized protein LOC143276478 isoform X2 [Babylonia areolata]|uniref:uncharacterized protein LOC143276478 isoform X2 n=1 Tax=Babylonia areolata TaxID=304850 RepID=UPI003FD272CF
MRATTMDMILTMSFSLLFWPASVAEKTVSTMTFTCSRPTSPCMNSATCPVNGDNCVCAPGYMGIQCTVLSSTMDLDALSCLESDPCRSGQCYDRGDGQGAGCICQAGYYGQYCQLRMFDVDCYQDRMVLYLLPWGYSDADTWISTYGPPYLVDTPAAVLSAVDPGPSGRQGFTGEFQHRHDPTGSSASVDFQNETAITYSRRVHVRYGVTGVEPTDQTLTASCTLPYLPPPTPTAWATPTPTTPPPPPPPTPTTTVTEVNPDERWSCLRPTTPCAVNGTCDNFLGKCLCPDGTAGLRCTVPEDKVDKGDCAISTLNPCNPEGAICYDEGYGAVCDCLDGYYGDHCQHTILKTECNGGTMLVNVFPYGFDAATWPLTRRPSLFPSRICPLKTVPELTSQLPEVASRGWEGFADVFSHVNDPCAGNATITSENETTVEVRRDVEVLYSSRGHHHTDRLMTATCHVPRHLLVLHPPSTDTAAPPDVTQQPTTTTTTTTTTQTTAKQTTVTSLQTTQHVASRVTPAELGQGQTTVGNQGPQPQLPPPAVVITAVGRGGRVVKSGQPVTLGCVLPLVFALQPANNDKHVTDIRVDNCVVKNKATGYSLTVVQNSCAKRPIGLLLLRRQKGIQVLVIRVYKFRSSVNLHLSCRIRMCTDRDTYCRQIPRCVSQRFKREAHDTPTMTSVAETTLIGYQLG